ncbi:MAG TPA: DUF2878 domain-containing protein [Deferrisomatales bacterium]|nr:DUF2878 domain-containing protein [Deferrisomatales bacterium]
MKTKLLNLALYQGGWFACVFGAADGYPWLGAGAALLLVGTHAALARERRAEWRLILLAGALGTLIDSVLMHLGLFRFTSGHWLAWFCPVWMIVMWMQFATLLRYSVSWLRGRYLLGAVLGAAGGPLAYASGVRLGAAAFGWPTGYSLLALALVWSVVTPALLWLEQTTRAVPEPGAYRL